MEDPGGLRDTLAHYWTAYHQEVRRQLSSLSVYGIDTIPSIPSHLMPGKRLIRTWETSDGHFLVEHISNPSTSYSDLYEDYLHTWPPRDQTLGELTGVELRDDAPLLVSRVFGKRQHDPGYDQAAMADYVERRDVISRAKVLELTEEEARRQATADLKPYIS